MSDVFRRKANRFIVWLSTGQMVHNQARRGALVMRH